MYVGIGLQSRRMEPSRLQVGSVTCTVVVLDRMVTEACVRAAGRNFRVVTAARISALAGTVTSITIACEHCAGRWFPYLLPEVLVRAAPAVLYRSSCCSVASNNGPLVDQSLRGSRWVQRVVVMSTYSSGALGRLMPDDVVKLVQSSADGCRCASNSERFRSVRSNGGVQSVTALS
jgi:predicted metal-binding protein